MQVQAKIKQKRNKKREVTQSTHKQRDKRRKPSTTAVCMHDEQKESIKRQSSASGKYRAGGD
jgi:hypothetical protein